MGKNKKYVLLVLNEDESSPMDFSSGHILTLTGQSIHDVEANLEAYERKMKRVLANHIEA